MGGIFGLPDPLEWLFEKYGAPTGDFKALCWAMAAVHEPRFKARKGGRPRSIDPRLFNTMVEAFASLPKLTRSDRQIALKLETLLAERHPHFAVKAETLRHYLPIVREFAARRRQLTAEGFSVDDDPEIRRSRLIRAMLEAPQQRRG